MILEVVGEVVGVDFLEMWELMLIEKLVISPPCQVWEVLEVVSRATTSELSVQNACCLLVYRSTPLSTHLMMLH
jgi:hypothetical protein